MKKYRVVVTYLTEVEAESEEMAEKEAKEQIEGRNWWEPNDYEVEEIENEEI